MVKSRLVRKYQRRDTHRKKYFNLFVDWVANLGLRHLEQPRRYKKIFEDSARCLREIPRSWPEEGLKGKVVRHQSSISIFVDTKVDFRRAPYCVGKLSRKAG